MLNLIKFLTVKSPVGISCPLCSWPHLILVPRVICWYTFSLHSMLLAHVFLFSAYGFWKHRRERTIFWAHTHEVQWWLWRELGEEMAQCWGTACRSPHSGYPGPCRQGREGITTARSCYMMHKTMKNNPLHTTSYRPIMRMWWEQQIS